MSDSPSMKGSESFSVQNAIEVQTSTLSHGGEALAGRMDDLAARLTRTAAHLRNKPLDSIINELGEIQSEGSIIDAMCGRYGANREALRLLRAITHMAAPDA